MPIRAVLFDAGETLLSPYPSFAELLSATLRSEGFHHVTPELVREQVKVVARLFEEATREGRLWSTSAEASWEFWSGLYRGLLEAMDVPYAEELARRLYATFTDVGNYRLFDDALPVLEKLGGAGLALGLISNFEEWLEELLEHLDVARFFEVRVISGAEGLEKPDPAIFRLALDRMGVQAEDAAYVGDNVVYDVEPAQSLGMTGVLLDRRGRSEDFAGLRITSLDGLPGALGL
ncbi:MAG TPA: HAD-IA family hydrolase [Actinomycetota bacterium]